MVVLMFIITVALAMVDSQECKSLVVNLSLISTLVKTTGMGEGCKKDLMPSVVGTSLFFSGNVQKILYSSLVALYFLVQ